MKFDEDEDDEDDEDESDAPSKETRQTTVDRTANAGTSSGAGPQEDDATDPPEGSVPKKRRADTEEASACKKTKTVSGTTVQPLLYGHLIRCHKHPATMSEAEQHGQGSTLR